MRPYRILARLRRGESLAPAEVAAVVEGAGTGSWGDAELGAFLMAAAVRGLDREESLALTRSMLESGERWELATAVPGVVDKHSTGGVGDKVSLILGPLLAACDVPVAMLTGRALGHTGGTVDKLECIPGLGLDLDRARAVSLLESHRLAIGMATSEIAPADRRLYALRDRTATVDSIPLVIASILSKKLATGAAAIVFDVKCGNGAIFSALDEARELATRLVETSRALGCPARALLTDMSQPLGSWVGNAVEVEESLEVLAGDGCPRLRELTVELALAAARAGSHRLERSTLEAALDSGAARERFLLWAEAQGATPAWSADPRFPRAPVEVAVRAPREGVLAGVATRNLGLLMGEAARAQGMLDPGVGLHYRRRVGERVDAGEELARAWIRRPDEEWSRQLLECFRIDDAGVAPALVVERID